MALTVTQAEPEQTIDGVVQAQPGTISGVTTASPGTISGTSAYPVGTGTYDPQQTYTAPIQGSTPTLQAGDNNPQATADANALYFAANPMSFDPNATLNTGQGVAPATSVPTGMSFGTAPAPSPIQQAYNNVTASGTPPPQDSPTASTTVNEALKQTTPDAGMAAKTLAIDEQLAQDEGYQQLLADKAEFNNVVNQSKSLVDTYKQLTAELGIPAMNEQLLNWKNIINGTESDIRKEIQASGGFATNSQVLALTQARNEGLIKNYNSLLDAKAMAMETVNHMVGLASQDRNFALQSIMNKMNIDQQIMEYRDKFVSAAKEGYNQVINAVGYQGLLQSLQQDPSAIALAEKTLGLQPGGLKSLVQIQQQQKNLANIQASGVNTRFVNVGGEIQDAHTGYAFSTPEEFFKAAGVSSWDDPKLKSLVSDITPASTLNLKGLPASAAEYEYAKSQGYTGSFEQYQNEDANRKLKASGAGSLGGMFSSAQINSTLNQIAGAFDNEPIVKNFNILNEGYQFANSLSNTTKNPADDQGLIYAFAKAMDPGSVVREGEYATVQKYAQSWVQSYGKSITQAIAGTGFLSADARANIKKTIEAKYQTSLQNYQNVYNQYQQRLQTAQSGQGNTITDYSQAYQQPTVEPVNTTSQIQSEPAQSWWQKATNWLWGSD